MNDGRNRFRNDERSPPARVRVRPTGVDDAKTDGESSELSASVLFDTLAVAMRRSDELPLLPPPSPPPPSEKMDRRFGNVSGDIAFGDDISPSSKHREPSSGFELMFNLTGQQQTVTYNKQICTHDMRSPYTMPKVKCMQQPF